MKFFLLIFLLFSFINCSEENPVKPQNKSPEIISLEVFPNVVRPTDSIIVICEAMDPDGDTLVYDWITTGVVRIKGARGDEHWLYHTYENKRIFYAPDNLHVTAPLDTFWVQCFVRDVRGGADDQTIIFVVKQDIGGE